MLIKILILKWFVCLFRIIDPFADATKGADDNVQDGFVHIRIQQRNGRKTLTTVQGLSSDYDLKKIVRACKKVNNIIFSINYVYYNFKSYSSFKIQIFIFFYFTIIFL